MRLKVVNISGSTIGLNYVENGIVIQDNLEPLDYRVVTKLTSQMKRLADPSLKLIEIKIIYEEVDI